MILFSTNNSKYSKNHKRKIISILASLVYAIMAFSMHVNAEFPNNGADVYNLVVLIRFADQPELSEEQINNIEKAFNSTDSFSLNLFYNHYTYNRGTCTTYLAPYNNTTKKVYEYQDSHPREYYLEENYQTESEYYKREYELISNALKSTIENLPANMNVNKLDVDKNGEVDNVTFVIQGKTEGWSGLLWDHQASMDGLKKGVEYYKSAIYQDIICNGLRVNNYNIIFESENIENKIGTIGHEFMHVFGYPDDYPESNTDGYRDVVLRMDLMQTHRTKIINTTTMWNKYHYGKLAGMPLKINKSGDYTLYSVGSDNGEDNKFWAEIETKSTSTSEDSTKGERIFVEYRKQLIDWNKNSSNWDFVSYDDMEDSVNGIIIYRVDLSKEGNMNAKDGKYNRDVNDLELYVYRNDEEDWNKGMTQNFWSGILMYAGDSYGNTDITHEGYNDTIYFTNKKNSGIKVTVLENDENTDTIKIHVDIAEEELAEEKDEEDEEPNPSKISKTSETTRVEGSGVLTGNVTREQVGSSSNYSTFSRQKGGTIPDRTGGSGAKASMQEYALGGSNLTTTVSTGGRSQVVDNPVPGQTLFKVYKEDGSTVQTVYPDTTSVSLASYTAGSSVNIGESTQYQASYIFTYMKENTSYNSEVQQALWATDLNVGEKEGMNALAEEAKIYSTFRNYTNSNGGYEKSITNKTVGQTVTYNRKTKKYTIGPFKVTYTRSFADVQGREKIDFGAMTDIKMYDQNGKEIDKSTWKIVWNEKDKKLRQVGDDDYAYPYSNEEFYIEMNYEGNEEVTRISKFEYYYKELQTTAEYVELNGSYAEFKWTQRNKPYICSGGSIQNPCKHGKTGSHIYAHDYWITAQKIREEESEKLISVQWADTTWNYYTQTVEFGEKKTIKETNNGNKYQIGLTLELTGYVWEDGTGYENDGDGTRSSSEKGINGVKVTLYKVESNGENSKTASKEIVQVFKEDGSKADAVTYTSGGKYHIEGIPVGEYNIEYTYDGQSYITTKLLEIKEETTNGDAKLGSSENSSKTEEKLSNPSSTEEKIKQYKEKSNNSAYSANSKAKENEEERKKYNNKFAEIVPGKAIGTDGTVTPLEYENGKVVTTDKEGHVKEEFAMKTSTIENNITYPLTDEFTISQKTKTINDTEYDQAYKNMYYVNIGLIKRADADFEIAGDIVNSKVTINQKEMTYTYGTKGASYTRELYKADMNYRIDDYKINNLNANGKEIQGLKSQDDELRVYVTYKITIKNTAKEVSGVINELVNYYDENYKIVTDDIYTNIQDNEGNVSNKKVASASYWEVSGQTGKINWTSSSKNSTGSKAGYKTAYTTDISNILMRGNNEFNIYITYEVNKNSNRGIITGEKGNYVEINSYSTYGKEATTKDETIGKIDKDSAPGDGTPYETENNQDDSVSIGKINIKANENTKRTVNGIVWEDARSNTLPNKQKVGNGKRDSGEKGINGVKVQLVEMIKSGNTWKEYVWQEMYSGESAYKFVPSEGNSLSKSNISAGTIEVERGEYKFSNYVAGNYKIKFVYGDSEKTITTSKNEKTYSGQDYKSTAYHQGDNVYEEWYSLSDSSINNNPLSDAKDNETRRLEVINYSKTVNNKNASVLVSVDTKDSSKYEELKKNTYMYAETAKINVKVEYDTTEGSGENSYTYNIRDIDLGLEERPKTDITITNEIEGIKIILSDGSTLIDTKEGLRKNVQITKTNGKVQGKIHIYMDEEVMQGAEVEITYKITVKNEGEVDSYGNASSVGQTYYTGKTSSDKTVTSKIGKIINYVDNSLSFKKENNPDWNLVENTSLQNSENMKQTGYLNSQTDTTQKTGKQQNETSQILINESLKNKELKPGQRAESKLVLTKILSPNDETDDLKYDNMTEIIEITNDVGRRNNIKTVGNQSTEGMPTETDAANTESIIITPPTGADKDVAGKILIAVGVLVIVGSGIAGVKMRRY